MIENDDHMRRTRAALQNLEESMAALHRQKGAIHPDRFALQVEALRRRDALSYDAASLVGAARTLVTETLRPSPFSLWRAAARVTAPSLVLFGRDDRLVHPRLAGHGPTLFAGLSKHVDLKLVSRLEFGSGAVAMRYVPRR